MRTNAQSKRRHSGCEHYQFQYHKRAETQLHFKSGAQLPKVHYVMFCLRFRSIFEWWQYVANLRSNITAEKNTSARFSHCEQKTKETSQPCMWIFDHKDKPEEPNLTQSSTNSVSVFTTNNLALTCFGFNYCLTRHRLLRTEMNKVQ